MHNVSRVHSCNVSVCDMAEFAEVVVASQCVTCGT